MITNSIIYILISVIWNLQYINSLKNSLALINILLQFNCITIMFVVVYDVSGAASDRNVVVLNDIHIDIMDYIVPASCNDTEFRQMWAEFEWENKVR